MHATLVVAVLLQCGLGFFSTTHLRAHPVEGAVTALHMLLGAVFTVTAALFVAYCVRERGLRWYFPYLWGDMAQLKDDVRETLHCRTVPPRAGGLATVVQGLGLGALLLAALSGVAWFFAWRMDGAAAHTLKEIHEAAGLLLCWFAAGHGGMALLHFVLWQKRVHPVKNDGGASPP